MHIGTESEMLAAIRARKAQLGVTNETIDAIAGLPCGYAGKLLADPPLKRMGALSLGLILGTLGYSVELVPDDDAFERVRSRMEVRKRAPQAIAKVARATWLFNSKNAREMGAIGGKARAEMVKRMAARAEINRANALKRWARAANRGPMVVVGRP